MCVRLHFSIVLLIYSAEQDVSRRMSIFIETAAREQHRVVHISTAANLV
jgi:hypothetical protein